jgi:hypothetical protein
LRGDRALHPDGVVFAGTFQALASEAVRGSALFAGGGERRALVRISRGAGIPEPLPDVLGCAIRVLDAYGPGAHQDFALASSRREPVARHVLLPARDFLGVFYSSVLPYRLGWQVGVVGGELESPKASRLTSLDGLRTALVSDQPLSARLLAASVLGGWRTVATLRLDRVVADAEARRLRFNPWNTGPGIRPIGLFNRLRDPAYRGSQAASPG